MNKENPNLPLTQKSRVFGVSAIAAQEVEYQAEVGRWSMYKGRPQSTAQHITSAVAVTAPVVCELLRLGGVPFDELLVLKCVAIHDTGEVYHVSEGDGFDTLYKDKTVAHDLKEYRKFLEIYDGFKSSGNEEAVFSFLSDQRVFDSLHRAYLLQHALRDLSRFPDKAREVLEDLREHEMNSALVFNLIERVGYIQYAYEQYVCEGNMRILVQTLNSQGPHIDKIMECFSIYLDKTVHGIQIKQELWGGKLREELFAFTKEFGVKYPNPPMKRKVAWFLDQTSASKS